MTRSVEARLRRLLRVELESLWVDLYEALPPGRGWSPKCQNYVQRMKEITLLVGPMPWQSTNLVVLASGLYRDFHAKIGVPVDLPTEDHLRTLWESLVTKHVPEIDWSAATEPFKFEID